MAAESLRREREALRKELETTKEKLHAMESIVAVRTATPSLSASLAEGELAIKAEREAERHHVNSLSKQVSSFSFLFCATQCAKWTREKIENEIET